MGYFDSAKNRVMWAKELEGLKILRKQFEETGIDPYSSGSVSRVVRNGKRIPVTFRELEREEMEAQKTGRVRTGQTPQKTHGEAALQTPEIGAARRRGPRR